MADTGPYTVAPVATIILPDMAALFLASLPSCGLAQPAVSANQHFDRFVCSCQNGTL